MKKRYVSPPAPAFISLSEYDDFQTPSRFIGRTLAETPLDSGRTTKWEVKLDFHVKSETREVLASGGRSFSAVCITVRDEDGMSWSAEAVNALLLQESSDLKRWCLSNTLTTDSLPVIADLIGLNTFLGLAATHGLTQSHFSFLSLRRGAKAAILVVAVLLGSALQMLGVWQRLKGGAGQTITSLLGDWIFYAINIGLAAIGLVVQNVMAKYSANPKSKAIEELAKNLQLEDLIRKQNFDRFVDVLARKLQSVDFPRAVIIDNFSTLDLPTKQVIARYFQKYSARARGSELWVIFQGSEGERFSSLAVQDLGSHGFRYTQFFEQLVFTEADKKDLIKAVGRKEDEAMVFVTAKRIVQANAPADKDTIDFFLLERTNHPIKASYGALDLFYLLSLTADRVSLTQNFVTANLSPKTGLTAEVLRKLLPGTRLRREEFNTGWTDIRQRFAPMLIVESDADSPKLRVIPEKTRVLEDMEDMLALPNTELGHVFWSLFWSDKLQNHPVQAVWTRKLTEHLLKSDASTIDEEIYLAVQHRLFDAILITVEGSLKTCLFSNITPLLQKGLDLANGELAKTDKEKKLLFRLLAKCWEAYSVLGSEEILRVILEIYEATPFDRERAVTEDRQILERLFFESIALAPDKRRRLKPNFFTRGNVPMATSDTMSDYATIRAAWLALAATRHMDSDVSKFFSALISADARLAPIASDSFARLNNPSAESIRLVNILTLSLSLWCRALRFNPLVMQSRIGAGLAAKRTAIGALEPSHPFEEVVAVSHRIMGDLPALIETAEDTVLLAAELSQGPVGVSSAPSTVDYLMRGLAKELCAVALASVVMANKYTEGRLLDETQIARVNDLIRISNEFLEYSLPHVSTSEDLLSSQLVSKVESIMKLCGLIWNEFGLERLRDFVNIRRVHFHAVCMMSAPDDFTAQNAMLKSLGHLLNEPDFGGIMANLVVSESLTSTEELEAYYLIHAAELGLADRFGQNVRNQLCLAAILAGHSYSYPLDPFIEHLLIERSDLASLLLRFLKSLPEEELEGTYLKLLNASKRTKDRNGSAAIIAVISTFANTIQDADVKMRVEALLDTFATEQKITDGLTIDVTALLAGWSDRKDLWLYSGLLNTLFGKGYGSAILQKEAVTLLENRDPANDHFNTYFLLSINLARHLLAERNGPGDRLIVKNYLKDSIEKWKIRSSADTNVRGFQLLYHLDPAHAPDYLKEIENWQMVKLERDHLRSLPRLLSHGQLFLVFQYYFDAMEFWGLRADISSEELAKLVNIPSDERRKRAGDWRAAGAAVPEPLIGKGISAVVSSKFLRIGSDLFNAPISEDANFDREREMLNERARSHLHNLLGLILGLRDLPMPAKDLIRSYSQRLETYTLPVGP